jgi:hypothetical protein
MKTTKTARICEELRTRVLSKINRVYGEGNISEIGYDNLYSFAFETKKTNALLSISDGLDLIMALFDKKGTLR